MTFAARIGDIHVDVIRDPERSWGSHLDGAERQISAPIVISGASKDAVAEQVRRLNRRLAAPCDLVMTSSGSTRPQALRLLGNGVASFLDLERFELGTYDALLQLKAPCAQYAIPANRVFLDHPFGDEWPDDSSVVRSTSDGQTYAERYVYAHSDRWCVTADASRTGVLTLDGSCIAGETLVTDIIAHVSSIAASALTCEIYWRDAAGSVISAGAPSLLRLTAVGRSRRAVVLTPPDGAASFSLALWFDSPSGACLAYIESVEAGVKLPGALVSTPCVVHDQASSWPVTATPAMMDYDFTRTVTSGLTWTYAGGYLIAAASAPTDPVYLDSRRITVRPGQQVGLFAKAQMTARTAGAAYLRIVWLDADGVELSNSLVRSATAVDSVPVTTVATAAAPAGAAYAFARSNIASGSTLTFKVSSLFVTAGILDAPGAVHLDGLAGEHPAPMEVIGDVGFFDAARLVQYAIASGDQPYILEAEALLWAGTVANAAVLYFHPGGGGTNGKQSSGTGGCATSIDYQTCKPGTYLFMVRGATNNIAYGAVFSCVENGVSAALTKTSPAWISLGQVTVPPARTRPGTPSNLTLIMASDDASGVAYVDRIMLLPLTQGGLAAYSTLSVFGEVSSVDVDENGNVLADGIVVGSASTCSQLIAAPGDRLLVNAEADAPTDDTHRVNLSALHTPLYDLWRGSELLAPDEPVDSSPSM